MERINTPSPLPLAYQTRFQILHLKNQKQKRVLKCQFDCLILKETFSQQQNNVAYIVFTYQWKAYLSTSSFPFPTFIVCGILLFKTNSSFRFLLLLLFLNDSKLNQSREKKKKKKLSLIWNFPPFQEFPSSCLPQNVCSFASLSKLFLICKPVPEPS